MGDVTTSDDIANGLCPDIVIGNSAPTKSSEKLKAIYFANESNHPVWA